MFAALVGVVELEIALVSRYWTTVYGVVWTLSYALVSVPYTLCTTWLDTETWTCTTSVSCETESCHSPKMILTWDTFHATPQPVPTLDLPRVLNLVRSSADIPIPHHPAAGHRPRRFRGLHHLRGGAADPGVTPLLVADHRRLLLHLWNPVRFVEYLYPMP